MPWSFLVKLAITMIISYVLRPKPEKAKPALLEDFDVPVAEDGKPICVVFGRRRVADPNIVWYGDLASTAIYKRL